MRHIIRNGIHINGLWQWDQMGPDFRSNRIRRVHETRDSCDGCIDININNIIIDVNIYEWMLYR